MPARPTHEVGPVGESAARAVAFGGGGEWFIAWMAGYTSGLAASGVDLAQADVTVGTSAGSIVGAVVKAGILSDFISELKQMSASNQSGGALTIPTGAKSQERARNVMAQTTELVPATIQQIGRAAMAARNAPDTDYIELIQKLLSVTAWPPGHFATSTDCYTGEPLIAGADSGVSLAAACAASSSLPGVNGPTWLDDRLCMDGGVSHSSTHAEVLAGAKSVLIIAMFDFKAHPPHQVNPSFGLAERLAPGTAEREAEALRAQGSTVHVTIANPDPQTDFMDPATIGPALEAGIERGKADAPILSKMW